MTSITNSSRLEAQIYAGWLGKAIGGTLGAPYEGRAAKLSLSYYDPLPDKALPNDDLDLQVVWINHLLNENVREVRPETLAQAWQRYVGFPWCEYGVGLRNMHYGLGGADLGSFDNWFADCMGAAIRSELWAFLAAGDIRRATHYAWADAVFDHAGDGVYAEIFFAVLQTAAFNEKRLATLIETALHAIPPASRVAFAVRRTQYLWSQIHDWETVREILITDLVQPHFTDVAINIAFIILGLLAGEGDFGKSICIANNCGWDTDCTAATVGALLGVIDPNNIPSRWSAPLNGQVALNKQIREIPLETTLSALTEQTLRLRRQLDREPTGDLPTVAFRTRPTLKTSPIHIPYKVAPLAEKIAGTRPASFLSDLSGSPAETESAQAPGHWFRHTLKKSDVPAIRFTFDAHIQNEAPARFMAYFPRPCRVYVDGSHYGDFDPRDFWPAWHGPSSHIFRHHGPLAPGLSLTPGTHRLDVVIDHDGSDSAELVVGVSDAETDQWLPFALARSAR